MITLEEYLMGRDKQAPLTQEMQRDALETVERVNKLLQAFGEDRAVQSGYRPPAINAATLGASKTSKHMLCRACDIEDHDGKLDAWCETHLDVLGEIGLWLEEPEDTPTWCHVQIVPPFSGHRIFKP